MRDCESRVQRRRNYSTLMAAHWRLCAVIKSALLSLSPALAFDSYRISIPNGECNTVLALGHRSGIGGDALNEFGKAFREAGYTWTSELCHADADGDGQSNGFELGDPCCCWSVHHNFDGSGERRRHAAAAWAKLMWQATATIGWTGKRTWRGASDRCVRQECRPQH